MTRDMDFKSTKQYTDNLVSKEKRLSQALDEINSASIQLEIADSYTFSSEIKTLQIMFKQLHKLDLFLCSQGTRTVKVKANKR